MRMRARDLILAGMASIAAVTVLGSCAVTPDPGPSESITPSAEPTPSPTPTPTPEPQALATLEGLQAAVSSVADADCAASWVEDNPPGPANSVRSGWCLDHTWGISFYDSVSGRNSVLELNTMSMESQDFAVGPDWLVTTDNNARLAQLADDLSAVYWNRADPIPTS